MLNLANKHGSLAGKLLLSSALVTVSLAYGWWQNAAHPEGATVPTRLVPSAPVPVSNASAIAASQPATPAPPIAAAAAVPPKAAPAPRKSATLAMALPAQAPEAPAMPQVPAAQPPQNETPPASPPPAPALTAQAALEMYLPTEGASPPLPPVSGTPAAGALVPVAAGTHLEDGDYLSDKHEFEWGDLKVKISVHGGQIIGVQIVQYPDHRSQSLYLSQMAGPILESEVIKSQQSQVDAVSSATDTSYAFQDTIANAILKATRG